MRDVVSIVPSLDVDRARSRRTERVVHAKGAGAHGVFEVTHDISDLTSAALFSRVGKTAPLTIRFSTVGGESGSADTARDPRGLYDLYVLQRSCIDFL